MKTKWYLSTLIFILALLGFTQKQVSTPNQEIVVQFSNNNITFDVAQNAIAIVKKQLQTIGVDEIQVRELADGGLKIVYYSDVDIDSIKEIFSAEENLELDYAAYGQNNERNEFPFGEDFSSYKLNIYEIKKGYEAESNLDGCLLEPTLDNKRFFNPVVYFSIAKQTIWDKNRIEKTAHTLHTNFAIAIENAEYTIPEVRAGPISQRDS